MVDFMAETGAVAAEIPAGLFRKCTLHNEAALSPVHHIAAHENLIIRGDNLAVLQKLQPYFAGKIKVIYIDPPYNTGTKVFHYEDAMSRPAWLDFMRKRLELAKIWLRNDGFLFVHLSFHQAAYIEILLDEIFDEQHICTFNLLVRHPDRILKGDKDFHDVIEYMLVYTKNKTANKMAKRKHQNDLDDYIYQIQENAGGQVMQIDGQAVIRFLPGEYQVIKSAPSADNFQKISIRGSLKEGNSSGRYYMKNLSPLQGQNPPGALFKVPGIGNDQYDFRYFYTPEAGRVNGGYFQGVPLDRKDFTEKPYPNFMDFIAPFNNVGYEGGVEFRNGKKPEALLQKVFELANMQPGDRVLDFFLGSGTTAAVAHKLGFPYLGIEQTDYGKNDAMERLKNVINGEQGGISKVINWQGGGQFIYCE